MTEFTLLKRKFASDEDWVKEEGIRFVISSSTIGEKPDNIIKDIFDC
jgi:hypothetical protein